MLVGMAGEEVAMAAVSSGCSSGCQSGWTTYLDDDHSSSYSCGTARLHGKSQQPYHSDGTSEDDLSMISDASSGPRQQGSAGGGNDDGAATHANNAADRRGRRMEPAATCRRQSKTVASLLEDTASSPAFFKYPKALNSVEANGYGRSASPVMEMGNAADFSATTTGFETPVDDSYHQMQYSTAPVKPMATRQVRRGAGEKKRW